MNHFTVEQRYKLEVLLQQNVSKPQISLELNKDISSIYREINRNSDARNLVYKGNLAIRKYIHRGLFRQRVLRNIDGDVQICGGICTLNLNIDLVVNSW